MRSQLGSRLQHCCKRLQDFCLSFEKGRITSFGEQDEIGLNRFPCLASYRSFQFLHQQVLKVSTYQRRPFKATSVRQDQLQIFLPYSFWLYSAFSRFQRCCTESPIPKEKVWRLHKGWDLFRPPNLSLTVHCLQASKCSPSTSQPCRYTMEGSAIMFTLPRVLPTHFQVWERTLRPRAASQNLHQWMKPHGIERSIDVTVTPAHAHLQDRQSAKSNICPYTPGSCKKLKYFSL